jgi:hypothetical protein
MFIGGLRLDTSSVHWFISTPANDDPPPASAEPDSMMPPAVMAAASASGLGKAEEVVDVVDVVVVEVGDVVAAGEVVVVEPGDVMAVVGSAPAVGAAAAQVRADTTMAAASRLRT